MSKMIREGKNPRHELNYFLSSTISGQCELIERKATLRTPNHERKLFVPDSYSLIRFSLEESQFASTSCSRSSILVCVQAYYTCAITKWWCVYKFLVSRTWGNQASCSIFMKLLTRDYFELTTIGVLFCLRRCEYNINMCCSSDGNVSCWQKKIISSQWW